MAFSAKDTVDMHLGGTMTVHEIVVRDEDGRRVSAVRITNLLRERG